MLISIIPARCQNETDYQILLDDLDISIDKSNIPNWLFNQISQPILEKFTPLSPIKINDSTYIFRAEIICNIQISLSSQVYPENLKIKDSPIFERWGIFVFAGDTLRAKDLIWDNENHDVQIYFGIYNLVPETEDAQLIEAKLNLSNQIGNYNPIDYSFSNDVIVKLDYTFKEFPKFVMDLYNVEPIKFETQLSYAEAIDQKYYQSSNYENIYNEKIEMSGFDVIWNSAGEAKDSTRETIRDLNLGVYASNIFYITELQGLNIPAPIGSNVEGENKSRIEIKNLRLQPDIVKVNQYYKVKSASVLIDTKSGALLSPAGIVATRDIKEETKIRTLGYKIQNYGQTYTIKLKYKIFSTANINIIQTDKPVLLQDILSYANDYYWNNYISGVTGVKAYLQKSWLQRLWDNWVAWWNKNYLIVLIVIFGILAIAVFILIKKPSVYKTAFKIIRKSIE